jgi:hypothetical protein
VTGEQAGEAAQGQDGVADQAVATGARPVSAGSSEMCSSRSPGGRYGPAT